MSSLALTAWETLIFYTVDLENIEQGHVVEKRYLRNSISNINMHKSHKRTFLRYLLPVVRYSHFKLRDLENAGQGHDIQYSQWRLSMENT